MTGQKHTKHITPSLLLSIVALVFAATGGAGAAMRLIAGHDIKNGTISLAKLTPAARAALHGTTGPAGPRGAAGVQGPPGAPGSPASVGVRIASDEHEVLPHQDGWAGADCPRGMLAIGGGGELTLPGGETGGLTPRTAWLIGSTPNENDHSWLAVAYNSGDDPVELVAYATCVPAGYV